MKLIRNPTKSTKCKRCSKEFMPTEPRFRATEGDYCFYDVSIFVKQRQSIQWIKENAHKINKSKGIVSNIINKIYNWMES